MAKREVKTYIDPTGENDFLTEETIALNNERAKILQASKENNKDFYSILEDRVTQGSLTEKAADLIEKIHRIDLIQKEKETQRKRKMMPTRPGRDFIQPAPPPREMDRVKKKDGGFPDLTGDGKVTRADILKGRGVFQEGGDVDTQMEMMLGGVEEVEAPMVPDEQMEEDYVDYVVQETLSNQDRNYLIDALEKDDRLSEIFDQVVESATEFTGSGTVEGPGTGKSDSIPARLSDGEFVFTAKATEELGADNLMSMMREAEREADERLQAQEGGLIEEEETVTMPVEKQPVEQDIRVTKETVGSQAAMQEQSDLVDEELKKSMLSTRPYVRS
tara:strand:+ start:74 stop:1069 length:996 start_codon:yes stop_codon:yes gene_type:complete